MYLFNFRAFASFLSFNGFKPGHTQKFEFETRKFDSTRIFESITQLET